MRVVRSFGVFLLVVFLVIMFLPAEPAAAQTASSGAVAGTVVDSSGAVVPNATVTLTNTETNAESQATTNAQGAYVFPNVLPGPYRLTVKQAGFRTATISSLKVEVNRSYPVNVTLEVGGTTEIVEVKASGVVELQVSDAQIGNVIGGEAVLRLPNLGRNASELLALQPAATQGLGGFPRRGVRVAGAIDDQNTITIDGIDISDNVVGGEAGLNTLVPVPTESVEEFRVGVSNPNANFGRASGGQMALVGRHGTNTYHGSAYWYHINDNLNANSWTLNHTPSKDPNTGQLRSFTPKAEAKDNRFGGRLGGPILRDKLFIFGHYEGRRNPQSSQILRFVPSDLLKQGILQFRDCASGQFDSQGRCTGGGNLIQYNLATSALCGSGGTSPCDPRGLGLNPTVNQLWGLMPSGNDPTSGDTINTLGFRANVGTPLNEDFYTVRPDYNITQTWRLGTSFTFYRLRQVNANQLDIRGGNVKSVVGTPAVASAAIANLTGQITNNLVNIFRFGYVRRRGWAAAQSPAATATLLNLPGSGTSAGAVAIAPALAQTGFLDAPIDVDTQRARFQATFSKSFQFSDDLTWVKGAHTWQFGADIRDLPTIHVRADKVVGSLTSLVAFLDADVSGFLSIPATNRPPTCSPTTPTNCIQSVDLQRWDRLYAATLGLVDTLGVLAVRDGQLNPLPLGTNLINDTAPKVFYFYGQDTWRIGRSLTLAYGLAYGWQTAPKDTLGRQTLIIDNATGKIVTGKAYLAAKRQAAEQGQFFNPELAFSPVRTAGRDVFNVDWTNWAPRAAIAWNPGFSDGFLGRVFGNRRSVVRGGFAITYDRSNTVQSVIIPMLGVGFGQTITVFRPLCNATGPGGPGCNPSAGITTNPGAASFRVGTDGTLPLPTLPPASNPVVPQPLFTETLSFQVDPDTKVGRSYNVDFTIQREMPGNMHLELGYIGHFGRHLPQAVGLNQSPYMFKDTASGQTFAQAFDAVATALRTGTPVTPQPWFEDLVGVGATLSLASSQRTAFVNGNVSTLFNSINITRFLGGLPTFNNMQVLESFMRTYLGESNYNALVVTLTKRPSHGLSLATNYTFSKALDDGLRNQNSAGFYSNSFFTGTDYGPSLYDRKHVFNSNFVYELPFGRGHRLAAGNVLDRVIGGWYTSGIFTTFSGLPLYVTAGGQTWGGGLIFPNAVPTIPTLSIDTGVHSGIAGSGGVGTTGNPTTGGTGLNLFSDPEAASRAFRRIRLSTDTSSGAGAPLRGLSFWNLDFSIGKATRITERTSIRFSFDFFNVFNNVNFADPTLDLNQNLANFGVINAQLVPPNRQSGSRWVEFGLRFEF
jgi:hypothetical protein